MTASNTESGQPSRGVTDSPGRLIAAAREAKSMGPADLAARLRLDTKVVKALERDDFENLPAPMFVKGYIRSIAKELDLDADTILAAYASHASLDPPTLADFSSRPPDQIGINSAVVKVVTYGLVGLLIAMIALWWRAKIENPVATAEPGRAIGETAVRAVPLPYTFDVVEHADDTWQSPPTAPAASEDVDDDERVAVTAQEDSTDAVGEHTLDVETTSEAWVEVYDTNDARLHFGMARSGKPVSIKGYSYYRLILGNTDSVTLRFDGKPVNLAPFAQNGVAQLELGAPPVRNDE